MTARATCQCGAVLGDLRYVNRGPIHSVLAGSQIRLASGYALVGRRHPSTDLAWYRLRRPAPHGRAFADLPVTVTCGACGSEVTLARLPERPGERSRQLGDALAGPANDALESVEPEKHRGA